MRAALLPYGLRPYPYNFGPLDCCFVTAYLPFSREGEVTPRSLSDLG